jgi:hypothetical protein
MAVNAIPKDNRTTPAPIAIVLGRTGNRPSVVCKLVVFKLVAFELIVFEPVMPGKRTVFGERIVLGRRIIPPHLNQVVEFTGQGKGAPERLQSHGRVGTGGHKRVAPASAGAIVNFGRI